MTPSPGVLNAFQQYQARQAGLMPRTQVSPKLATIPPKLTDEKRAEVRQALLEEPTNIAVVARCKVSHGTVERIKAQMKTEGLL